MSTDIRTNRRRRQNEKTFVGVLFNSAKRNKLWLITIVLLFMTAFLTESKLPLFLFATSVNYVFISYGLALLSGRRLKYQIKLERVDQDGGLVYGRLVLENMSLIPCFFMKCTLEIKNHLTGVVDGNTIAVSLWPKRKKYLEFQFSTHCCGKISVSLNDLRSSEPLGILRGVPRQASGKKCQYVIMPNPEKMISRGDDFSHYDMESYKFSQYIKGTDTSETVGMKSYEVGDSVKSIHWKLSSKLDDVVVRELGYPISNRVAVLVDKVVDEIDEAVIYRIMNRTATISKFLEEKEITYQMIWYDPVQTKMMIDTVRNANEGSEAVLNLVSSPVSLEGNSVASYIGCEIDKSQSMILFITARKNIDEEVNLLRQYGEVQVYREK